MPELINGTYVSAIVTGLVIPPSANCKFRRSRKHLPLEALSHTHIEQSCSHGAVRPSGAHGFRWRNAPQGRGYSLRITKESPQPKSLLIGTGPHTPLSLGSAPALPLLRRAFALKSPSCRAADRFRAARLPRRDRVSFSRETFSTRSCLAFR